MRSSLTSKDLAEPFQLLRACLLNLKRSGKLCVLDLNM